MNWETRLYWWISLILVGWLAVAGTRVLQILRVF